VMVARWKSRLSFRPSVSECRNP